MPANFIRTRKHNVVQLHTDRGIMDFRFKPGGFENAELKADAAEREIINSITERLGRPPTQEELLNGKVIAGTDSRTIFEKVSDEKFKPVKNGEPTYLESLLADADAEVQEDAYRNMTDAEKRREDIARLVAQKEAESDAQRSHAARLEKHGTKIQKLKQLQTALNWNESADEKDRVLVSQAIAILETPGADLRPATGLMKQIEDREHARKVNELAALEGKAEELAAQQQALAARQSQLIEEQHTLTDGGMPNASQ